MTKKVASISGVAPLAVANFWLLAWGHTVHDYS